MDESGRDRVGWRRIRVVMLLSLVGFMSAFVFVSTIIFRGGDRVVVDGTFSNVIGRQESQPVPNLADNDIRVYIMAPRQGRAHCLFYWIHRLFSDSFETVSFMVEEDLLHVLPRCQNCVFVLELCQAETNSAIPDSFGANLISELENQGRAVCLAHWCDELPGDEFRSYYSSRSCVFRNYFTKNYMDISQWIPVGPVGPRDSVVDLTADRCSWTIPVKKCSQRKNKCMSGFNYDPNLAGLRHESRRILMSELETPLGSMCTFRGNVFSFEDLDETVFVPNPFGNDPECHRLWETLEHGAIPLTLDISKDVSPDRDFFSLLPPTPFPLFSDWKEALTWASSLSSKEIDEVQSKSQEWYCDVRRYLQRQVRQTVEAAVMKKPR